MTNLPNTAATWHDQRRLISKLRIPGIAKAVLNGIHGYLGRNLKAWPSLSTLAEVIGFARRSVIRAIDYLIELGILHKVRRWDPGAGCYRSNVYGIRWEIVTQRIEPVAPLIELESDCCFEQSPKPDLYSPLPEPVSEGGVVTQSHQGSDRKAQDRLQEDRLNFSEREDFDFSEEMANWDPSEDEAAQLSTQIPELETGSQQPVVQQDQPDSDSPSQTLFPRPDHQTVPARNLTPLVSDAITDPLLKPVAAPPPPPEDERRAAILAKYQAVAQKAMPDEAAERLKDVPLEVLQNHLPKFEGWLKGSPLKSWERLFDPEYGIPKTAADLAEGKSGGNGDRYIKSADQTRPILEAANAVPRHPNAADRFRAIKASHIIPGLPAKSRIAGATA